MSGIGRMAAAAGLVMVTAGCYEHTYTVGRGAPAGPIVYEEWQNHWLGGLIGHDTHELETVCPSGNATIHDEQSFLNGLVSALTGGIYSPTTVRIRCATGQRLDLELSEDDVLRILTAPAFMDRVQSLMPGRLDEAQRGVRALDIAVPDNFLDR